MSKDIIFDESCVFDKYIDNSPSDADFAALALLIEDITPAPPVPDIPVSFEELPVLNVPPPVIPIAPPLRLYEPEVYRDMVADLPDPEPQPSPLVVADPSEYVEQINQYGHVQYWNSVTGECSNVPVKTITSMHFGIFMSMFLMSSAVASLAPNSFVKAILNPLWHPPILKELDNFCENTCFQWIPDIGQRRL